MRSTLIQVQNEPYVAYERAECLWKVLVKQVGNEDRSRAAFRTDWEGGIFFSLLPPEATEGETALLDIRIMAQTTIERRLGVPAISVCCHIPAVIHIEPAQHRILVELRCVLYPLNEPPTVLVAPDPELALHFLQPEEDPIEAHYAAERPTDDFGRSTIC